MRGRFSPGDFKRPPFPGFPPWGKIWALFRIGEKSQRGKNAGTAAIKVFGDQTNTPLPVVLGGFV